MNRDDRRSDGFESLRRKLRFLNAARASFPSHDEYIGLISIIVQMADEEMSSFSLSVNHNSLPPKYLTLLMCIARAAYQVGYSCAISDVSDGRFDYHVILPVNRLN